VNFDSDWPSGPSRYWGRHRRRRLRARTVWRMLWRRTRRGGRRRQADAGGGHRDHSGQDNDTTTSQSAPERVLYLAWSADNATQNPRRPTRQGPVRRAGSGRQ
jgi:hypothetical protein